MTDLYLHIGSNKTATTTLQYRLSRSADALAASGVLYALTGQSPVGAHHKLAGHLRSNPPAVFRPEGDLEALIAALREELAAAPSASAASRMLISSEMLFWLKRNDLDALGDLFSAFSSVKVIAYLRRQDSYLPSFYSSLVANGSRPSAFETFCEEQSLDYLANLDAWAEFVGAENIIARPFQPRFWVDGDIVVDFLARIGCELPLDQIAESDPRNQALSLEVLEMLLAAGAQEPLPGIAECRAFLGEYFSRVRETAISSLMTAPILKALRQRYDAGNRELGKRYFAEGEREALAYADDEVVHCVPYEPLASRDYAGAFAALWKAQLELQAQLRDGRQQLGAVWAQLRDREGQLRELRAQLAPEGDAAEAGTGKAAGRR